MPGFLYGLCVAASLLIILWMLPWIVYSLIDSTREAELYKSPDSHDMVDQSTASAWSTASSDLSEWAVTLCGLAHQYHDYQEVAEAPGFLAPEAAAHTAVIYAASVSLPWAVLDNGRAIPYTDSADVNHSLGTFLPPSWVQDGDERGAVTDWFMSGCIDSFSDPELLPLSFDHNSSGALIAEHDLLGSRVESDVVLRQTGYNLIINMFGRGSCPKRVCSADTVFS